MVGSYIPTLYKKFVEKFANLSLYSLLTTFIMIVRFFFNNFIKFLVLTNNKKNVKIINNFFGNRLYFFYTYDYVFALVLARFFNFFNFRANYRKNYFSSLNYFFVGFKFLWKHIKLWVPSFMLFVLIVYYSLACRLLPFLKITIGWFLVFMLFYWLISGFVFFVKRYRYGKFTSAIQRFWRRSLIIFWLIESSLFIVFIYLLFNASQEPVFMYDFIQLQKTRLYSWKFFLYKIFLVYLIIMCTYFLLLSIKWNVRTKINYLLIIITLLLTYVLWTEFYQFFYTLNWYGEICWIFDIEDRTWYAESTFKRARIVNHYVTICIIAKFWHIVFIYIYWVFFLLRFIETGSISYVAVSTNLQNFLILYFMNWLLMYPWLKKIFRKFLWKNHGSFNEFRKRFLTGFFNDLKLYLCYGELFEKSSTNFLRANFPYAFSYRNWENYGVYTKQYITSYICDLLISMCE